jgi:hypothetical protein
MPAWLERLDPELQAAERTRFLLRIAALYVSPEGSVAELSRQCGLAEGTLASVSKRQDLLSPEMVISVEKAVGRDIMPRELFRPDLFTVEP